MGNAGRMRPVCGCIFRLTMGCERVRSSQSDIGYPRFGRLYRSEPERRVGHLGIEHQPVLDLGRGRGAVHALYQHRQRDFAGGDHTALQGRWHYRRSDRDGQQQHDGFCDRHRRCGVVHFRHVGRHHIRPTGFAIATGDAASFIFDTLDGTISGWNHTVNATEAQIMVDNSASGAVYTGLAIGTSGSNTYLYAANLHSGTIDVFDSNYKPVTLPNAFQDGNLPAGYAPFNIQNLAGNLYVAYALQNTAKNFAVLGAGNGYVDVYSTAGTLMDRLISSAHVNLNAPW